MKKTILILIVLFLCSSCSFSEEVGTSIDEPKVEPVVEEPKQLAKQFVDLDVKPVVNYGRAGEQFSFSVRMTSRGTDNNFQVKVHHTIKNKETSEVLVEKDETITLEIIASKRSELIIPKDAKKGKYVLETTVTYESGSADASFEFDIEPAVSLNGGSSSASPASSSPSSSSSSSSSFNIVQSGQSSQTTAQPNPNERFITFVNITGLGFVPLEVHIKKGSWVKWRNVDINSHTATGSGFDAVLRADETYIHQFNETRVYSYSDTFSGIAPGTVYVEE